MINLSGIPHVLLRVADGEASKRSYRYAMGLRISEQEPEYGGVFMTLGGGFPTLDIARHPVPESEPQPQRGWLGPTREVLPVSRAMGRYLGG